MRSDLPVEVQIAELVREQALRLTKEEVPHALTAEVTGIEEGHVTATIFVETESWLRFLVCTERSDLLVLSTARRENRAQRERIGEERRRIRPPSACRCV